MSNPRQENRSVDNNPRPAARKGQAQDENHRGATNPRIRVCSIQETARSFQVLWRKLLFQRTGQSGCAG